MPKVHVYAWARDPPPDRSALAEFVAAMPADTWAQFPTNNIGPAVGVGNVGDMGNRVPYAISFPRDGKHKRCAFVGCDHGVRPGSPEDMALIAYRDGPNAWETVLYSKDPARQDESLGSHMYQKTALDPETGDVYLMAVVREPDAQTDSGFTAAAHIYKSAGGTQPFQLEASPPESWSQLQSTPSLMWWRGPFFGSAGRGVLVCQNGNAGSITVYDPFSPTPAKWPYWRGNLVPGQSGNRGNVSAYSDRENCMVFGGGMGIKAVRRLNADGTVSPLPDAPFPLCVFNGGNFVGDGAGRFIATGFGQVWKLDAGLDGVWVMQHDPPADMCRPDLGESIASCDLYDLGAAMFVDHKASRGCKVWIRKA